MVHAIHAEQLREHGGLPGVRDEHALESSLARPRQRWSYEPSADLATLAACYAHGLSRSHPYRDGNKRIAFLVMVTFLGINRVGFEAPESQVVAEMLLLAEGTLSEDRLAAWIRSCSRPEPAE